MLELLHEIGSRLKIAGALPTDTEKTNIADREIGFNVFH